MAMNIVIFSGGTGSIALQTGLRKLIPSSNVTNIINLYDDGKSTGIARMVCDVLGPSDVRKSHYIQYVNEHKDDLDPSIVEFYESRFNIISKTFVYDKLENWGLLERFSKYVDFFFNCYKAKNLTVKLNDFSIANIVYAAMFKCMGVQKTIEYFRDFLSLKYSNILINSEENLKLYATTKSGKVLGEEEIVKHFDADDPITSIKFMGEDGKYISEYQNLNKDVEDALDTADIIIFSSGTQWSSLIPTYANKQIKEAIERNSKKTIFVVNNEQDGDMSGVSSNEMVCIVEKYISLKDTKFIINADANKLLNSEIDGKDTYISHLGNTKGKHDPDKLAKTIIAIYYGVLDEFSKVKTVCLDFDDTIFSRNDADNAISLENCKLVDELSKKKKVVVISGNGYKNIADKLCLYFNYSENIDFDIWADGGVVKYYKGKVTDVIPGLNLNTSEKFNTLKEKLHGVNNIQLRGDVEHGYISCISMKPFSDEERVKTVDLLNYMFDYYNLDIVANARGRTSIDITRKNMSKLYAFEKYYNDDVLFIGDELEAGNDADIFDKYPSNCIRVKDVYAANVLLKLLSL